MGSRLGALAAVLCAGAVCVAESLLTVDLWDMGPGVTSPAGTYRWMDVADHPYGASFMGSYQYSQSAVTVAFFTEASILHGALTATHLKPNFAYQFKIVGLPESHPDSNERIGFTGRWWQEEWDGAQWVNGWNLNDKGDGSSPNPNDLTYLSRRDIQDPTSPTGKRYRYTAYLVVDYFITDEQGDAFFEFVADESYHVLWKTSQMVPTFNDGPVRTRTFAVTLPDPVAAYNSAWPQTMVGLFGEWERLPKDGVTLPVGSYTAMFLLTEESFHGGGLAGGWASALGSEVHFSIVANTPTPTATMTPTPVPTPVITDIWMPHKSKPAASRNTDVLLQWSSVTGVTYSVEASDGLESPVWTSLAFGIPGAEGTTTYADNLGPVGGAVRERVYRVREEFSGSVSPNAVGVLRIDVCDRSYGLFGMPLIPDDVSIQSVIGWQLTGGRGSPMADVVDTWAQTRYHNSFLADMNARDVEDSPYDGIWYDLRTGMSSTDSISWGEGFWVTTRTAGSQTLYVEGEVADQDFATQVPAGPNGILLLGHAFQRSMSMNAVAGPPWGDRLNYEASGGSKGETLSLADTIIFRGCGQAYRSRYLGLDGFWRDPSGAPTTEALDPAEGFWVKRGSLAGPAFTWTLPSPF